MALHRAPAVGRRATVAVDVKYHIDYDWWTRANRDLRVYLRSHLCQEHQGIFVDYTGLEIVDWIDPRTAEVRQVNGLEHTLHSHCSLLPNYITPHTPMIDAVFRVFLANGNTPLTVDELAARTGRRSETIRRAVGGGRIYKGIRPVPEEE